MRNILLLLAAMGITLSASSPIATPGDKFNFLPRSAPEGTSPNPEPDTPPSDVPLPNSDIGTPKIHHLRREPGKPSPLHPEPDTPDPNVDLPVPVPENPKKGHHRREDRYEEEHKMEDTTVVHW